MGSTSTRLGLKICWSFDEEELCIEPHNVVKVSTEAVKTTTAFTINKCPCISSSLSQSCIHSRMPVRAYQCNTKCCLQQLWQHLLEDRANHCIL